MYAALADALEAAHHDSAVRAVVIQGHETIFRRATTLATFEQAAVHARCAGVSFLRGISSFPKPLVAAVCGPAVGIGTTLLLHCDLVYAGDNAAFSMPFVNLGLCPEAASSFLVPQLMGYPRAAEALLLGEPFMAETALELGLVNRIVPPAEANALAQRQALKLAAKPLSALMETKRLMKKAMPTSWPNAWPKRAPASAACSANRPRVRRLALSWRSASRTSQKCEAAVRARGYQEQSRKKGLSLLSIWGGELSNI